jgi:spore coat polysaccharide biosynthesis protein SpsF (cytidylyltransferase family)
MKMVKYNTKELVIIQARMNSDRLPGKVMLHINGKPVIKHIWDRLDGFDRIIATGSEYYNYELIEYCKKHGMHYYEGSDDNVLHRFQMIADLWKPVTIIRITGDCPLVDAGLIKKMLTVYYNNDYYYLSNVQPPTYPDGYDIEIFDRSAIYDKDITHKEHVTLGMRGGNVECGLGDKSNYRLTLDYPEDYQAIKFILENCKDTRSYKSVLSFIDSNPAIKQAVQNNYERFGRNEK